MAYSVSLQLFKSSSQLSIDWVLKAMRRHRPMLCTVFLRHCLNAHLNAELLQALTNLNSTRGQLFNCPPDDEDFVYVPAFFDWLHQVTLFIFD